MIHGIINNKLNLEDNLRVSEHCSKVVKRCGKFSASLKDIQFIDYIT